MLLFGRIRFIALLLGLLMATPSAFAAPRVVKVLQFNLQRCNIFNASGVQTGRNVQDVIRVIQHLTPDLVSLNEIEPAQATQIAQAVGMNSFYGRYDSGSTAGIAVLCRTAIVTSQDVRVPNYSPDTFLCLDITTQIDGQTVRFYSTHPRFNDTALKPLQMFALMNRIGSQQGARILAGDFNDMDDRPNSYSNRGFINLLTGGSHGSYPLSTPKLYDVQRKCGIAAQTKNNPPYFAPASDWNAPYTSANTISQWSPRVRIDHIFASPEFYLYDPRNSCQALDTMVLLRTLDPAGGDRYVGDHRPLYAELVLPKPTIQLQLYPNFPLLVLPRGADYDLKVGGLDTDGTPTSLFTTDISQVAGDPELTGRLLPKVNWSQSGGVVSLENLAQPVDYDAYLKYDRPAHNVVRVHAAEIGQGTITASSGTSTKQILVKVIPRGILYEYNDDEARTVTVAPSGANFTSVKAAVDSFNPGGANANGAAPKTILIVQNAIYQESGPIRLQSDGEWTIRATAAGGRATLVIPSPGNVARGLIEFGDSASPFDDGIMGHVMLENLVILPASEPGIGIRSATCKGITADNNADGLLSVTMRNVLLAPNNGSNVPASDGVLPAAGSYTRIGSDGLRLLSGVDSLYLEDVTVTHCAGMGVNDNGDIAGPPTTERIIAAGCRFSFNDGSGYYVSAGDITAIAGEAGREVTFANNLGSGLRFNSSVNTLGDVSYARFIGNGDASDSADASGVHLVGTAQRAGSAFRKCVFAFNGSNAAQALQWGNLSVNNSQNTTFTFLDCTFLDARFAHPSVTVLNNTSGDSQLVFRDVIFAGGGGGGADDILYTAEEQAGVTLEHCALVTQGPNALDASRAGDAQNATTHVGAGPGFQVSRAIHTDPEFVSIDPESGEFINLRALNYLAAAADGGILSGAGEYAGQAGGRNWTRYELLEKQP